jgi:hypothetical protein
MAYSSSPVPQSRFHAPNVFGCESDLSSDGLEEQAGSGLSIDVNKATRSKSKSELSPSLDASFASNLCVNKRLLA